MGVRAFEGNYHFYRLLKDIPCVNAGSIFYWDMNDNVRGSTAEGCLKLCWTQDGNCFGNSKVCVCGDTIVFHANARNDTTWFAKCHTQEKTKKMTLKEIEYALGHKVNVVSE